MSGLIDLVGFSVKTTDATKSQLKQEFRYYPVTLFKTATEILRGFQHAELQARFGGLRLQM